MILEILNSCVYNLNIDVYFKLNLDKYVQITNYLKHTNQKTATLNISCKNGWYYMVQHIINNEKYIKTNRAIPNAVRSGNIQLIDFLIKNKFVYNQNIFIYACKNNKIEVVHYLHETLKMNCSNKMTDIVAKNGNLELMQYLIEKMKLSCGNKTFDIASENGHLNILKYLWDHNSNKNRNSKIYSNRALNGASRNGHINVVYFLREKNVNITQLSIKIAIKTDHIMIANYLTQCIKSTKSTQKNKTRMQKQICTKKDLKKIKNMSCEAAINHVT